MRAVRTEEGTEFGQQELVGSHDGPGKGLEVWEALDEFKLCLEVNSGVGCYGEGLEGRVLASVEYVWREERAIEGTVL